MSNIKGPAKPAVAAPAAPKPDRVQLQRDINRQVKNQQLGASLQASQSSAANVASSGAKASSSASSAPKAAAPKAPSSPSTKAPSQPAIKQGAAKAPKPAGSDSVDRMKAHEAADVDGGSDSFTSDSSAQLDIRRMLGAVEENTGQRSAITQDFDNFDPGLPAQEVEQLGNLRGAVHMARLLNHWEATGVDHTKAVQDTAAMLLGFARPEAARGLMKELERAPIKSVYPLEVQMALVDLVPEFFPTVSRGPVVENKDVLEKGERIMAGHDTRVHFPAHMKLKAFAMLGTERPGYEFEPLRNGVYRLLIDTPGTWNFAVRGEFIGKSIIDTFSVTVRDPAAGGTPEHAV